MLPASVGPTRGDGPSADPAPPSSRRAVATAIVGACLVAAAAFLVWVLGPAEATGMRVVSGDIYRGFLPTTLVAARAVRHGGAGLWWNPFQSCGQPLFGVSSNGLLYPPYLAFLVLPPDAALAAVVAFNALVAGLGTYLLCRTLGAGRTAALIGALAVELGNAVVDVASWTPVLGGAFAWLPVSLYCCERLLAVPTLRRGVVLAVALALAWLPGHPQVVLFAYELVGLRVLWELATRPAAPRLAIVGATLLGLLGPPLVVAVQLLPGLEVARASVRGVTLAIGESTSGGSLAWGNLALMLENRAQIGNPFLLVPCVLAAAGFSPGRRRLFFAVAAALAFGLSFGPQLPLYALYARLPLVGLFRDPIRFNWVADVCIAILAALGLHTIATETRRGVAWAHAAVAAGVLVAFAAATPGGLHGREWALGALVALGAAAAGVRPRLAPLGGTLAAAAAVLNLLSFPLSNVDGLDLTELATRQIPLRRFAPSADLFARADGMRALRARLSPQDRVMFVPGFLDYSLQEKTAGLFGFPAVFDYEPQPARRYSELWMMMRRGRPMKDLLDLHYEPEDRIRPTFQRRLLDLVAGRYVVAPVSRADALDAFTPPLAAARLPDDVVVGENVSARPRAFFVPRVEVVADPAALLERLTRGSDDLAQVALLEAPPPTGFLGTPGAAPGAAVTFERDDPEAVTLRVRTPRRGFVFLSDQDGPGWVATVDGRPAALLRANYAFRLVEVPAGDSSVAFRYRPWSVYLGAAISLLAAALLAGVCVARRRPHAD